jgi:hypothetical protein
MTAVSNEFITHLGSLILSLEYTEMRTLHMMVVQQP